jgi:Na+/melibiose symporter-like transporter
MAVHYGRTRSIMGIVSVFTNPFVSALSDTFGRKHLQNWGRLGVVFFFGGYRFRDRSLVHRMAMEVGCWGIAQAGTWAVFAASHADLFGNRPELSSRIQAADGLWVNAVGVLGGVLTTLITRTLGLNAGQTICAVLVLVEMCILQSMPETLPKSERKPFKLGAFITRANPLSNVLLLFRKGPGLRRLAGSTLLFFCTQEVWATQSAFRLGTLGWQPTQMSYFTSGYDTVGWICQGSFSNRLLRRVGNRKAFEVGALVAVLSYAMQGLCMLGSSSGGNGMATNVKYIVAICLLQTVPPTMPFAVSNQLQLSGMQRSFALGFAPPC